MRSYSIDSSPIRYLYKVSFTEGRGGAWDEIMEVRDPVTCTTPTHGLLFNMYDSDFVSNKPVCSIGGAKPPPHGYDTGFMGTIKLEHKTSCCRLPLGKLKVA